jgi:hypothetical protein
MGKIVKPDHAKLKQLVEPFLAAQPKGLGFAIGYASPEFATPECIFFDGDMATIRHRRNAHGAAKRDRGRRPAPLSAEQAVTPKRVLGMGCPLWR